MKIFEGKEKLKAFRLNKGLDVTNEQFKIRIYN